MLKIWVKHPVKYATSNNKRTVNLLGLLGFIDYLKEQWKGFGYKIDEQRTNALK
jgi:hypothetical protein